METIYAWQVQTVLMSLGAAKRIGEKDKVPVIVNEIVASVRGNRLNEMATADDCRQIVEATLRRCLEIVEGRNP